jgi:hypothetical protein
MQHVVACFFTEQDTVYIAKQSLTQKNIRGVSSFFYFYFYFYFFYFLFFILFFRVPIRHYLEYERKALNIIITLAILSTDFGEPLNRKAWNFCCKKGMFISAGVICAIRFFVFHLASASEIRCLQE